MKVVQVSNAIDFETGLEIFRDLSKKRFQVFYKLKQGLLTIYRRYDREDKAAGLIADGDSQRLRLKKYLKKGGQENGEQN